MLGNRSTSDLLQSEDVGCWGEIMTAAGKGEVSSQGATTCCTDVAVLAFTLFMSPLSITIRSIFKLSGVKLYLTGGDLCFKKSTSRKLVLHTSLDHLEDLDLICFGSWLAL
jgi:hypothetical protein